MEKPWFKRTKYIRMPASWQGWMLMILVNVFCILVLVRTQSLFTTLLYAFPALVLYELIALKRTASPDSQ